MVECFDINGSLFTYLNIKIIRLNYRYGLKSILKSCSETQKVQLEERTVMLIPGPISISN